MVRESVLTYAADHPAFAGHFPGAPIVPGVLLLDAALREIEAASGAVVVEIISAKFLHSVLPGEPQTLSCESLASGRARFVLVGGEHRTATGQLLLHSAPTPTTST